MNKYLAKKIFSYIQVVYVMFISIDMWSQENIDKKYLKNTLQDLGSKYNIPNTSILVIQNNEEVFKYEKEIGDSEKNYFIGSCSKSITSLAILQLVDADKIKLDDAVVNYLPWFSLYNKQASRKITVRHLLNQTSGMKTSDGHFDYFTSDRQKFQDIFSHYLTTVVTINDPGQKFNYCNLNYILLGLIISEISGESYDSYLTDNIFSKIGMLNTYATYDKGVNSNLISGNQDWFHLFSTSGVYEYSDFFVPTGLITSNTLDISKYLTCLLDEGVTKTGDTIISSESLKLLFKPKKEGYGMGWMDHSISFNNNFSKQYEIPFIFHTGSVNSFISSIAVYPNKNLTISILANSNSFEYNKEALNIILASSNMGVYRSGVSKEKIFKKGILGIVIIVFFLFLFNIWRWKKVDFKFKLNPNKYAVTRLIIGILLSTIILLLVKNLYGIPLKNFINYQPDLGYSILFISFFGFFSSIVRYLRF